MGLCCEDYVSGDVPEFTEGAGGRRLERVQLLGLEALDATTTTHRHLTWVVCVTGLHLMEAFKIP